LGKRVLNINVFDAAIDRLIRLYRDGHRVVVSFSAGKDSGICLELAIIAASVMEKLPVDVVMRDEEIMYPGTFEYAERMAKRPEVKFHWMIANQPVVNCFNRKQPYFWVFDPLLKPEQWVRQPPDFAVHIEEKCIEGMITKERFPPDPGKELITIIGLRTQESMLRRLGVFSSQGYITKSNRYGCRYARPIYDWSDGDVWKAVWDNKWDYNEAYDVMHRLGVHRNRLRIAPPTLTAAGIDELKIASQAWPKWFDKVCERLPGVRTAAMFGRRAVEPNRRLGETWEQVFKRECLEEAPDWIRERAQRVMGRALQEHNRHSTHPFPQSDKCNRCQMIGSWKHLAKIMYMGDPFAMKTSGGSGRLTAIEPEFFRPGAGTWGGKPTW